MIRTISLGTLAQRQESARKGLNSGHNVKKSGAGPVTLPPSDAKLEKSNRGCKAVRKKK